MSGRCKTVKEITEMLEVTPPTVYKLLRDGKLQRVLNSRSPSKRGGRPLTLVTVDSVVDYIKSNYGGE